MTGLRTRALKLGLKIIEPFQGEILKHRNVRRVLRKLYTVFSQENWFLVELEGEGIKIYINRIDVGLLRSFTVRARTGENYFINTLVL
jgi:hypothetical protein